MVYAVCMRTIRNFERALGRPVHWAPTARSRGGRAVSHLQAALQLNPHYRKIENAYYQPERRVLFRLLPASADTSPFPGTIVFTCLSQDVIAHELTHALLVGHEHRVQSRHNPDVLALHEAFADLVALLQHFWPSDVLRAQIAQVRGDLHQRSASSGPSPRSSARRSGARTGSATRSARPTRAASGIRADPIQRPTTDVKEPHARGDILVGAVFDAFNKLYESRVGDLRRIATRGTGHAAGGHVHPDLVDRFTREASRSAQRVLDMCIRALDYMPPVEMTFGDFLRAIITADDDLEPATAVTTASRSSTPSGATGSFRPTSAPSPSKPSSGRGRRRKPTASARHFRPPSSRASRAYWNLPRDREAQWQLLEKREAPAA